MSNQGWLKPCPQLPSTILRIYIPAGAVINLLNLLEISTPSGICLIIRVPVLSEGVDVGSIMETLKKAGAKVELVNEGI